MTGVLVVEDEDDIRLLARVVLERLQLTGAFAKLAVIVVSAHADPDVVDRARDIGAWGYLHKPFQPSELVALVHEAAGAAGVVR